MKKKILILLYDGVSMKNFVYTDFSVLGKKYNFETTYINPFKTDLTKFNLKEIKIKPEIHVVTNILKSAIIISDIKNNIKRSNDKVYENYFFKSKNNSFKKIIQNFLIQFLVFIPIKNKTKWLYRAITFFEKRTLYYKNCLSIIKSEKPSFVFITSQRPSIGIAPIIVAKELNIPTASFIFSWDNLPKATKGIETDYYFVWSNHMKKELLYYYPYIKPHQIFVTGTPQFEPHTKTDKLVSKEIFFNKHRLDCQKKYICFSGDDVTTSPNDPQYLEDIAEAVLRIDNTNDLNIGIIFRRCPVDFSNRYDYVLKKYENVITPIEPIWEKTGGGWDTIMPTKEDVDLLINVIEHTEFVINVGSSMVFDYVSFNKPCFYLNYDTENKTDKNWSIKKIYNFVHFRSMPNKNAVVWLNSKKEIEEKIVSVLNKDASSVDDAKKWFEIINQHPTNLASERIWESIIKIANQ